MNLNKDDLVSQLANLNLVLCTNLPKIASKRRAI